MMTMILKGFGEDAETIIERLRKENTRELAFIEKLKDL